MQSTSSRYARGVTLVLTAVYFATIGVQIVLSALNLRHRKLHGQQVPDEFRASIDPAKLAAISAYHVDRERFGLVQTLFWSVVTWGFLFAGGLSAYGGLIAQAVAPGIWHAVIFFVALQFCSSIIDLPFDAFSTFRIEQRHGFNRMGLGLFLADWIKGVLIGSVFTAGLSALGVFVLDVSPRLYWLWFWFAVVIIAIVLLLIAPFVIEPLFFKTSPLKDEQLAIEVRALADRAGAAVGQVLEVDASRRTAHSNAYFTGIGRVKRVVLFDTLLRRLSHAEVLAVLAHELGHWRLRHVTKRLVTTALIALGLFYLGSTLLGWAGLPAWFGMTQADIPTRVIMLAFLAQLIGFFFAPLSAALSRRHEWQADAFAAKLTKEPEHLAAALTQLAQDNLTNLHPHPLYSAFHDSHPAPVARIRKLREMSGVQAR